jgi:hypothetical protein
MVRRTRFGPWAAVFLLGAFVRADARSGQSATSGPSAPNCRTYITEATNVTRSAAGSATTSYSCSHDSSTHQTTCNVTLVSSPGSRFSYAQITTYRSTADVVDEVRVIPPLTLSVKSTGGISFTLTNSYDAQGRLTRMVNTTPGSVLTTIYTAWDRFGRPTAGASDVPLVLSYDDAARSVTTTYQGRGVTVQTFDANGNPTELVERFGDATSTTTTNITSTGTVCK